MTPTKTIGDYTAAATIDGSTHFLLIQPGSSSTAYNKINRTVFLGVSGQPMDISTTQTVSNKVLNNTNLVTLLDGSFTLQNNVDSTKRALFSAAGITTATTRTYTLPNNSSTLVDLITTQTLTNKTLTAPTISGGTIDNSTVTVDAISGHTVANNGTIYGVSITGGKFNGSAIVTGTIGSTALATNAVQANQLATNAITLGYAQITANPATFGATFASVAGLSVTVIVPAGGRRVKVTAFSLVSGSSTADAALAILEGSSQLSQSGTWIGNTSNAFGITVIASFTPTAGSHTYFVQAFISTGTGTVNAGANASVGAAPPAYILVEVI